jgi:hypothetical protein
MGYIHIPGTFFRLLNKKVADCKLYGTSKHVEGRLLRRVYSKVCLAKINQIMEIFWDEIG